LFWAIAVMTPASSDSAYATGTDCIKYFDARFIGDLLADDGTRVAAGSIAADAKMVAALEAASGEVESAALKGARYRVADLQAMTGMSLSLLKRTVCRLAIGALLWRRNPTGPKPEMLADEEERLQALQMGIRIFGFEETQDAGSGSEVVDQAVTQADVSRTVTGQACRMFNTSLNEVR